MASELREGRLPAWSTGTEDRDQPPATPTSASRSASDSSASAGSIHRLLATSANRSIGTKTPLKLESSSSVAECLLGWLSVARGRLVVGRIEEPT